ncbi:lipoyltransferase 1, mitochondrial-like [Anneissia japonica]|uniref:lipoyltransferase 1, mitochondrial-like n=1 Tax=Anneissia japonica TaxID=1529436 RepID=UPI0014257258|nr:lipoyltransferase 1, mitochondrial-like [Anneissia japonica]
MRMVQHVTLWKQASQVNGLFQLFHSLKKDCILNQLKQNLLSLPNCTFTNIRNVHRQSKIPQGLVYLSTSNDVFSNLAFEDWVHDNLCLTHTNILFLWRNKPAVVIGRHQNPWSECNIQKLVDNDIQLARRRSGGGTVYHDLGNLNCTFFTERNQYNRRHNLELMVAALRAKWPSIQVSISNRDDLLLDNFYKISFIWLCAKRIYALK